MFQELSIDEAMPLYCKLKSAMNTYKHIAIDEQSLWSECYLEIHKLDRKYVKFFGIPNVCLCVFVNVPGVINQPMIDLFVDSQYQGNGLGTKMIDYCKQLSNTLYLNVLKNNINAKRLYERNDFKIIDETEDMYTMMYNSSIAFSDLTYRLRTLI